MAVQPGMEARARTRSRWARLTTSSFTVSGTGRYRCPPSGAARARSPARRGTPPPGSAEGSQAEARHATSVAAGAKAKPSALFGHYLLNKAVFVVGAGGADAGDHRLLRALVEPLASALDGAEELVEVDLERREDLSAQSSISSRVSTRLAPRVLEDVRACRSASLTISVWDASRVACSLASPSRRSHSRFASASISWRSLTIHRACLISSGIVAAHLVEDLVDLLAVDATWSVRGTAFALCTRSSSLSIRTRTSMAVKCSRSGGSGRSLDHGPEPDQACGVRRSAAPTGFAVPSDGRDDEHHRLAGRVLGHGRRCAEREHPAVAGPGGRVRASRDDPDGRSPRPVDGPDAVLDGVEGDLVVGGDDPVRRRPRDRCASLPSGSHERDLGLPRVLGPVLTYAIRSSAGDQATSDDVPARSSGCSASFAVGSTRSRCRSGRRRAASAGRRVCLPSGERLGSLLAPVGIGTRSPSSPVAPTRRPCPPACPTRLRRRF